MVWLGVQKRHKLPWRQVFNQSHLCCFFIFFFVLYKFDYQIVYLILLSCVLKMNLARVFFLRWTNPLSVRHVAELPLEELTAGKGCLTNFLVLEAQLSGVRAYVCVLVCDVMVHSGLCISSQLFTVLRLSYWLLM